MKNNDAKFEALRSLNLPPGQYAITGSGPMGIRNLRDIDDIDLVVTRTLWLELAARYGVSKKNGIEKIIIAGENIEVFQEGSFLGLEAAEALPSVAQRIAQAEIIDGLPFESLEHVLYYKRQMGREKDLKDIAMIEDWLAVRH